jgi:hypothetical protein
MRRISLAGALILFATIAAAACGGGFDNEEATATCNEDRTRLHTEHGDSCVDAEAFAQCVSCHEECGDACATIDTVCPARFQCPAD